MFLERNGVAVTNFGLLGHGDIDQSDDPANIGSNLVCRTDNTSCCRGTLMEEGLGTGSILVEEWLRLLLT